ncbi:unnamed protein product [Chrysoparadoxa australica]
MGKVIDRTTASEKGGGTTSERDRKFILGAFGLFALGSFASWLRVYSLEVAKYRISRKLKKESFASLLAQEAAYFEERRTGELLSILNEDTLTAAKGVTDTLAQGVRYTSSVVNGTLFMLFLSPKLTLISFGMVPLVGCGAMMYSKYVKRLGAQLFDVTAESAAFAEENISSHTTIQLFTLEKSAEEGYTERMEASDATGVRLASARGRFMGGLSATINSSLLSVLYYGGRSVAEGSMTVGSLTSFAFYSGLVGLGFSGLASVWSDFTESCVAGERVLSIINRRPAVDAEDGMTLSRVEGTLSFENVHFQYPLRDLPVLQGMTMRIQKGRVVALTGPSGAGKSTVAKLICRLYEPTSGHITLDGVDISKLSPKWLRQQVAVVDQSPILFSGSVLENIRHGREGASDDDVQQAAREANAHDFIAAFPQGYETRVGERGKQLSGGQMQRVAIARAILKQAPLLILDEATSALDDHSEALVHEALGRLMANRTCLVIAHRESTIATADEVVALEHGVIDYQ